MPKLSGHAALPFARFLFFLLSWSLLYIWCYNEYLAYHIKFSASKDLSCNYFKHFSNPVLNPIHPLLHRALTHSAFTHRRTRTSARKAAQKKN